MSQTDRQDIYLKIYLKRQRQSKPKAKKLSFFFFFFFLGRPTTLPLGG